MRDGDDGTVELVDRFLDLGIGVVVNGGGGFIHHENFWVLEESARETEELALPLREIVAGFCDGGGEIEEYILVGYWG